MRSMHGVLALIVLQVFASVAPARAQSAADSAAIKQTALDYLEGWYQCAPDRMERAVHPDLAKRIVSNNPQTGKDRLDEMSALKIVQVTRGDCGGKKTSKNEQQKDITIFDVYQDMASVKVVFTGWVDYVHMATFNGRWVIVNVLRHLKPTVQK